MAENPENVVNEQHLVHPLLKVVNQKEFLEIYNIMDIDLTKDQYNILQNIWYWYHSPLKTCAITGFAGTGKSYLTNAVNRMLNYVTSVGLTAPTHEAKRVLENFTGCEGATLHSILGLRLNTKLENFDIDRIQFDQQREARIKEFGVILPDEASMINNDLHKLTVKEATKAGCKIIYVGDDTQLPPVDEDVSVALHDVDIVFKLTKPIRQNPTNPLYYLLMCLVHDIHRTENSEEVLRTVLASFGVKPNMIDAAIEAESAFDFIVSKAPKRYNSDGEGYMITESGTLAFEKLNELFDEEEQSQVRYIAYTNANVSDLARTIRNRYAEDPSSFVEVGDKFKAYSTVLEKGKDIIIRNSEEYEVVNVEPSSGNVYITVNDRGRECHIQTCKVTFTPIDSEYQKEISVVMPPYDDFKLAHDYFYSRAINRRQWSQYFKFKEEYFLMEDLKGKIKPTRGLKLPTRDIDFNKSITAHKSQGSTFEHVIVNMKDIHKAYTVGKWVKEKKQGTPLTALQDARLKKFELQLLYVALSRGGKTVTGLR